MNLSQTQKEAKQAYLKRQQETMLNRYKNVDSNERKSLNTLITSLKLALKIRRDFG